MTRRGLIAMLAGAAAMAPAACGGIFPHSYRFRMTVEVETPEGLKSGSAVYEVTAGNVAGFLPEERKRDWAVTGEAAAVELPHGQVLFSVLRTRNPKRQDLALMSMAALDPAFHNDVVESAARIAAGNGTLMRAPVQPSDFPMLMLFENPLDPTSAKEIDPANASAVLGTGYNIRGITVQLTREPVTTGLSTRLRWLPDHHGALLKIPISNYPPPGTPLPVAASLTERDFSQGLTQ